MATLAILLGAFTGMLAFLAALFSQKTMRLCAKCSLLVAVVCLFYAAVSGLMAWTAIAVVSQSQPDSNGLLLGGLVGLFTGGILLYGVEQRIAPIAQRLGLTISEEDLKRVGPIVNSVVARVDEQCNDEDDAFPYEVFPRRIERRYTVEGFARLIKRRFAHEHDVVLGAEKRRVDREHQRFDDALKSALELLDQAKRLRPWRRGTLRRDAYREIVNNAYDVERMRRLVVSAARPSIVPKFMRRRI